MDLKLLKYCNETLKLELIKFKSSSDEQSYAYSLQGFMEKLPSKESDLISRKIEFASNNICNELDIRKITLCSNSVISLKYSDLIISLENTIALSDEVIAHMDNSR